MARSILQYVYRFEDQEFDRMLYVTGLVTEQGATQRYEIACGLMTSAQGCCFPLRAHIHFLAVLHPCIHCVCIFSMSLTTQTSPYSFNVATITDQTHLSWSQLTVGIRVRPLFAEEKAAESHEGGPMVETLLDYGMPAFFPSRSCNPPPPQSPVPNRVKSSRDPLFARQLWPGISTHGAVRLG